MLLESWYRNFWFLIEHSKWMITMLLRSWILSLHYRSTQSNCLSHRSIGRCLRQSSSLRGKRVKHLQMERMPWYYNGLKIDTRICMVQQDLPILLKIACTAKLVTFVFTSLYVLKENLVCACYISCSCIRIGKQSLYLKMICLHVHMLPASDFVRYIPVLSNKLMFLIMTNNPQLTKYDLINIVQWCAKLDTRDRLHHLTLLL